MDAGSNSPSPAPRAGTAARLTERAKARPLLAVATALGGLGTFIASLVAVAQLFVGGSGTGVADTIPETGTGQAARYEFRQVETDLNGRISVDVPTAWGNVRRDGWHATGLPGLADGELIGPGLNAAPNIDAWRTDLQTPGVFIGVSREILDHFTPTTLLDGVAFESCDRTAGETYTSDRFTGDVAEWSCARAGGTPVRWLIVAATPTEKRDFLVYIQMKLVSPADEEAYNKVLNTFEVKLEG